MEMNRLFFALIFILVGSLICSNLVCKKQHSDVEYINPPGWENDPCFTHQSWGFNETGRDKKGKAIGPKAPFLPDGSPAMVNPYGRPVYTFYPVNNKFADWEYTPRGMKGWARHGMWGAMGASTPAGLIFDIPSKKSQNTKTELWLQYVISQYKGTEFTTIVYTDEKSLSTIVSRDKREIRSGGGSGKWYRITEIWEIAPSTKAVHVKIEFSGNIGLIEHVAIDTRCVPIK